VAGQGGVELCQGGQAGPRAVGLADSDGPVGGEVDVAGVALIEDQIEHAQHRGTSPDWLNRTPETVRLALLIRRAMVASGTR
jgi:hypothetical protein